MLGLTVVMHTKSSVWCTYVHTSPLLHKSFISKYKYYRPQDRAAFTQCLMTNSTEYPAARIWFSIFQLFPGVFEKEDGAGGHKSANKSNEIEDGMLCSSAARRGRRVGSGKTFFIGSKEDAVSITVRLDFLKFWCEWSLTTAVRRVGLKFRLAGTVELEDFEACSVFWASAKITAAGALELAYK